MTTTLPFQSLIFPLRPSARPKPSLSPVSLLPGTPHHRLEFGGAAAALPSSVVARAASASAVSGGVVESLGDVSIFAASTGVPVLFSDLWDQNEGIAVIALLRHFGCPCCWELASVLKESLSRFDSAGVKLIAIGVGTPDKARILAERLPFPLEYLYADPERKAKVFSRYESLKKAVKNYTINATPDDRASVLQQGGMFVFKGKELLYARKDEGTGDHAPLEDVLNICCKIPAT